jgi:outer membrane protein, heavy metal efflux system
LACWRVTDVRAVPLPWLLAALAGFATMAASDGRAAAAGLSEQQAVVQGLAQPRVLALFEPRRARAAGLAAAAGRWDNPELEFSEESLDLPGRDGRDQFLWLRQRFNVGGARGLERRAAQEQLQGRYARIELERRELAREIRALYYDVVAARQRFDAHSGWQARLEVLVAAVEARARAGDAARYDALRLRQESSLVRARVREAEAELASAREALFALIGVEPVPLTGVLLPPDETAGAERALEAHPTLRALEAEAGSAETRARAARRDAWPDVTVGIGRRDFREGAADANGGLIAIGVELPLFNRNRGETVAAESEASALRAEASLQRSRLQVHVGEAQRLLAARRAAVRDLQREAAGGSGSLPAMAEAAYAAGEIDVMALIDAHRTELATASEITALARAARAAYIQLQYLSGEP